MGMLSARRGRAPFKSPESRRVYISGRISPESAEFLRSTVDSLPEGSRNHARAIDKIVAACKKLGIKF